MDCTNKDMFNRGVNVKMTVDRMDANEDMFKREVNTKMTVDGVKG